MRSAATTAPMTPAGARIEARASHQARTDQQRSRLPLRFPPSGTVLFRARILVSAPARRTTVAGKDGRKLSAARKTTKILAVPYRV